MGLKDWLRRRERPDAAESAFLNPATATSPFEATESLDGIYLGQAVQLHLRWRNDLREAVEGGVAGNLDAAAVSADNLCPLGEWIYSHGRRKHGRLASFERLRRIHADFHRLAGQIVTDAHKGDTARVEKQLRGPFIALSDQIQLDLVRLFGDMERRSRDSL